MIRSASVVIALVLACFSAGAHAGAPQPYSFADLMRVTEQTARDLGADPDATESPGPMAHQAADIVVEPGAQEEGAPEPEGWLGALHAPQPAGWLMLASGLAIVGFIGRRRATPVH